MEKQGLGFEEVSVGRVCLPPGRLPECSGGVASRGHISMEHGHLPLPGSSCPSRHGRRAAGSPGYVTAVRRVLF